MDLETFQRSLQAASFSNDADFQAWWKAVGARLAVRFLDEGRVIDRLGLDSLLKIFAFDAWRAGQKNITDMM